MTQINSDNIQQVAYGTLWSRLGAILIDILLIGLITFPLTIYNVTEWKIPSLFALVYLVGLAYKPFCEYKFGSTLGKLILKLKVVNLQFDKPNLTTILLRNVFHIIPGIFSLIMTLILFKQPAFEQITTLKEYSALASHSTNLYNILLFILVLIDIIFLLTDIQKRTLHDRIGKTFVIRLTK